MPFVILFHPVEGFEEMRWNKKESIGVANWILVAFFMATVISQQYTGFIFNNYRPEQLNVFTVFMTTIVVFLLVVVSNMAVCTLSDGEGSFKDVWVNLAYSLVPYIIFLLIATFVSNFMTQQEGVFYGMLVGIGVLWTMGLMFLGLKTAHQFTMGKTVGSVLLTLAGVVIIVFLILLVFALVQQMMDFITTVYNEIRYRM
nr:Yip1 family protein [bacterium]